MQPLGFFPNKPVEAYHELRTTCLLALTARALKEGDLPALDKCLRTIKAQSAVTHKTLPLLSRVFLLGAQHLSSCPSFLCAAYNHAETARELAETFDTNGRIYCEQTSAAATELKSILVSRMGGEGALAHQFKEEFKRILAEDEAAENKGLERLSPAERKAALRDRARVPEDRVYYKTLTKDDVTAFLDQHEPEAPSVCTGCVVADSKHTSPKRRIFTGFEDTARPGARADARFPR